MMMNCALGFLAVITISIAINVKFNDAFGGMRNISIPSCRAEPCDIVQGVPLVTDITFIPESLNYFQGKTFVTFTTGYISVFLDGYGDRFGIILNNDTDLTKYDPSFPLKAKQISTARVPLFAPRIDPKIGPVTSAGEKFVRYSVNVGNATDFITVASASIHLNVIH